MPFIDDFIYDPHSGRPVPPKSWLRYSCQIWVFRIMAAMTVIVVVAILLSGRPVHDLASPLLASTGLLAVSEFTAAILRRRRAALADATRRYEAMIARPFG